MLAARGTAQSEVLTRITIYLTLVSAGLVTIGLLGQASGFQGWFAASALSILGFLSLIGVLTQIRVMNVGEEDMMYVVAMNRLRVAYNDLDPVVAHYFLAASSDDREGMERTYSFLRRRSASHLIGSSNTLMMVVNAVVVGLTAGSLTAVTTGSLAASIAVGTAVGVLLFGGSFWYSVATFLSTWRRYEPLRRSPGPSPNW
ncbi:hypothetical protein ASD65_02615 [Microbacterium sp. Root61]|nr:hypothetical protein ASD65_02615 [Microbacterium sp. Root61]